MRSNWYAAGAAVIVALVGLGAVLAVGDSAVDAVAALVAGPAMALLLALVGTIAPLALSPSARHRATRLWWLAAALVALTLYAGATRTRTALRVVVGGVFAAGGAVWWSLAPRKRTSSR
jgi:hypothetical protein